MQEKAFDVFKCLKCNKRCYRSIEGDDLFICGDCKIVYSINIEDYEDVTLVVSKLKVMDKEGVLK